MFIPMQRSWWSINMAFSTLSLLVDFEGKQNRILPSFWNVMVMVLKRNKQDILATISAVSPRYRVRVCKSFACASLDFQPKSLSAFVRPNSGLGLSGRISRSMMLQSSQCKPESRESGWTTYLGPNVISFNDESAESSRLSTKSFPTSAPWSKRLRWEAFWYCSKASSYCLWFEPSCSAFKRFLK